MRASPELILRISSIRRATPATRIVRLALDGQRFDFKAGQAALIGPAGRHERVPYSLACAPEEARRKGCLEFLIRVETSGRWGHLFDRLARGMRIGVRGPLGSFVIPDSGPARSLLFIAGGTGIAPVRSMIVHSILTRRPGRLKLLYSARTASDFSYLSELRGLSRRAALELRLHVTREAPPRWRQQKGRIAPGHLAGLVEHPDTLCFVCGPAAMVAEVPRMLRRLGVPPARVKVEEW